MGTSEKLQQAISAVKTGDKTTGRQLLIEIVKTEPKNENAWLWLLGVIDSDEHRKKCLEQVIAINPDNQIARRKLAALNSKSMSPIQQSKRPTHRDPVRQCPNCSQPIKADSKFCKFCGIDLELKKIRTKQPCPSCKKQIDIDSKFCPNCGSEVGADPQVSGLSSKKPIEHPTKIESKTRIAEEIAVLEENVSELETRLRQYEREFDEAKGYSRSSDAGLLIGLIVGGIGLFFGSMFLLFIGLGFFALALLATFVWSYKKGDSQKRIKRAEEELSKSRVKLGKLRAKLAAL